MALVHMIGMDVLETKGVQHRYPAHPQHDFLTQAVVRISTVQCIGQALLSGTVIVEPGVKKVDWDGVAKYATDQVSPRANMDLLAFDGHQNPGRHGLQNLFEVPGRGTL
jgi:hypothetical protein